MQARRRTDILATIVLALAFAPAARSQVPAPTPTPSPFDPRRPPAQELETRVPDGFTLAAVGDLITTRPLVQTMPNDPNFAAVVQILRAADTAYGNFETTAVDLRRFAGQSYPGRDDWPLAAVPEVARDLRSLGFDFVSRANNHAMDYGIEGMRETSRWLEDAGIVYAGIGENRGDARSARYLELPTARIGLVSMASTYRDYADALPPQGRAPGRPGINALRTTKTYTVAPETLTHLRSVKEALEAPGKSCEMAASEIAHRTQADAKATEELTVLGTSFRAGAQAGVRYEMNPIDLDEILRSVRLGKQHSDLLVATIHSHDTGLGCEEPGDFLPLLAKAAIDAGAGLFIGTGEHRLMPIEIYKGRPIFYSLANFFWSDMQEALPADLHEDHRDALAKAYGASAKPTDADLNAVINADGFDDERVFQTVVAVCQWRGGKVAEVRLHPVDLGYGLPLTKSGTPRLASPAMARSILERLQRISKPYGTTIEIEGGVGVIRIP
jgi:poly-gamma-glutamate capsule biosynthesis protein CapA/YwtB (metallophosphatase superfamily)